ncbi:MAG: hypothetical protein NTV47_02815 [Actinobacteria bacterium]|nr:hypothetical protein [Actinomycetota bacterium]
MDSDDISRAKSGSTVSFNTSSGIAGSFFNSIRRSSRCSSFPKRALPPLPGRSGLADLSDEDLLDGREDEDDEDGLAGLSDEDLLGGREEDGLSDEDLPDPLGGRDELELLLGLSDLSGLSDPDCLGVLPESLTI